MSKDTDRAVNSKTQRRELEDATPQELADGLVKDAWTGVTALKRVTMEGQSVYDDHTYQAYPEITDLHYLAEQLDQLDAGSCPFVDMWQERGAPEAVANEALRVAIDTIRQNPLLVQWMRKFEQDTG